MDRQRAAEFLMTIIELHEGDNMLRRSIFVFCLAVSLVLISTPVFAQRGDAGAPRGGAGAGRGAAAPDPVKKAVQIKPNIWMIADGGANTVVEVTPEGLIVCDTK